jgi:hypothetical protein
MDYHVVKIMCPIPVKLLNNYGFITGFHRKNLVLIWFFQHYGLVFQPSKNLATLQLSSSYLRPYPWQIIIIKF